MKTIGRKDTACSVDRLSALPLGRRVVAQPVPECLELLSLKKDKLDLAMHQTWHPPDMCAQREGL